MRQHLVALVLPGLLLSACPSPAPVNPDGGSCGDTQFSNVNCGTCGHACAATEACSAGRCLPQTCGTRQCSGDNVCVDGVCVDRHCSGISCPSGQVCAGGMCLPASCSSSCTPTQVCFDGGCVEAACVGVLCPAGLTCVAGSCAANTCSDGIKSGTETDTDCGGDVCPPCLDGRGCAAPLDCTSRVCTAMICQTPTCTDNVKNGSEGDVDCGGATMCMPCANGRTCTTGPQCLSLVCSAGHCATPSCTDMIKNGTETDVDCGAQCPPCADGKVCTSAQDCTSNHCTAGKCSPMSCADMMKDGTETDIDCGGLCPPCAAGKLCTVALDCASGVCNAGTGRCSTPTCLDGVKNGPETDVDCGATCPACEIGQQCMVGTDCVTGACSGGTCRPPSCTDGVRNGSETDTDCGGDGGCARCGTDGGCVVFSDCVSGTCFGNMHCDAVTFFSAPQPLVAGTTPEGVAIADIDVDGLLDVAIANFGSGNISVWFQEADGGLSAIAPLQVTMGGNVIRGPSTVIIGDLTGDGLPELVVGRDEVNSVGWFCRVSVLQGAGNRSFLAGVDSSFQVPAPGGVASGCGASGVIAKLNSDAKPDLVLGDGEDSFDTGMGAWPDVVADSVGGVALMQGTGLAFGMGQTLTKSGAYIAVGDVNSDGFPDVVGHSGRYTQLSTFLGSNTGTFAAPRSFGVAAGDGAIALGQMTSPDTALDAVFATKGVGAIAIAKGLGTGDFLAPQSFNVASPDGIALADIDGDGKLDVVVGAIGVAVMKGNGDGTVQPPVVTSASIGDVGPIAVGDLNGDGKPDVACISNGTVYVLYNVGL
jgi:hypothetical protein